MYNTNVIHVDHKLGVVTCENGEKYSCKTIIVACGAVSD